MLPAPRVRPLLAFAVLLAACGTLPKGQGYRGLLADPKVAGSIVWDGPTGPKAYPDWTAAQKADLARALKAADAGRGSASSVPPAPTDPAGRVVEPGAQAGFLSAADAWTVYLSHVAHSLWLERTGAVPWSLREMAGYERALLLDSRKLMRREKFLDYRFFIGLMGNALSWNPRLSWEFMKGNGMLKPTPAETLYALTSWMRREVRHALGTSDFSVLYGYDGPPPVDAVLFPPAAAAGRWRFLPGCWGVTGFYGGVLRGANIPVENLWTEEDGHSRPVFPTAGVALHHGDDIYSSVQTPTGNVIPSAALFAAPEAVRAGVKAPRERKAYDGRRRDWDLGHRYLSDHFLFRWMTEGREAVLAEFVADVEEAERRGRPAVPYEVPLFTPEEGRAMHADAEVELRRIGGGDLEAGKALVKKRYLGFWNESADFSPLTWR